MMTTTAQYDEALTWVYDRIAPHFRRAESRRRAWTYLIDLPRVAEEGRRKGRAAGRGQAESRGDGVQRLLKTARWDEQAVLGELQDVVRDLVNLSTVDLIITEMSFRKKGSQSAAAARQFSLDSQKLENCQVAMMMYVATPTGEIYLFDRRLYVPSSWQRDSARCRAAGIPSSHCGDTKTGLILDMLTRAMNSGFGRGSVSVLVRDIDRGAVHQLLTQRRVPHFLLCSPGDFTDCVASGGGGSTRPPRFDLPHETLSNPVGTFRRFAGGKAAGFETSLVAYVPPSRQNGHGGRGEYLAHVRDESSLPQLAERITMARRAVNRSRAFKEQIGLEHYEVRSWVGWHRHITLAAASQIAYQLAHIPCEAGYRKSNRQGATAVG